MKFLFSYAICCVLTTSIQTVIIIINEPDLLMGETTFYIDTNDSDPHTKEWYCQNVSPQAEINKVVAEGDDHIEKSRNVRPVVSPSILMSMFNAIYNKTDIFPDKSNENRRVTIRSIATGNCVDLAGSNDAVKKNSKVIQWQCHSKFNQLIFLDHVGDGYVSMRFSPNYCIGIGYDPWDSVFVSTSDEWCKSSPSHQWAILHRGDHVVFQQKETKRCLSSSPANEDAITGNKDCSVDDVFQKFQICNKLICWP